MSFTRGSESIPMSVAETGSWPWWQKAAAIKRVLAVHRYGIRVRACICVF